MLDVLILAEAGHAVGPVVDLLVILATASAVTMGMRRLKLATIPGYLIAGALVGVMGPWFGVMTSDDNVQSISSLATILLMFTIGLHLDIDSMRGSMVHVGAVGVVSTLLAVVIGAPVGLAFGLSMPGAIAVAMALSMSSTAVVLRVLQEEREIHALHGRICFGILVVQDLFALVFLALLPVLAQWSERLLAGGGLGVRAMVGGKDPVALIASASIAIGGMVTLIVAGRYLLPKLLTVAARQSAAEGLLVLSAAVALGAAIITSVLGFSPELGAFLAGFLLASTPFKHQISGQLAPMSDLFMAVFFTSVGLKLNIPEIAPYWWVLLLALAAVIVVKTLATSVTVWAAGGTAAVAGFSGLALAQAGEFSLVILAAASERAHPIISHSANSALIGVVVISLILTPTLYDVGRKTRHLTSRIPPLNWLRLRALRESDGTTHALTRPDGKPLAHHVIIAGFGIVGRNLVEHFEAAGINFAIVELNPDTVRRQRSLGRAVTYGDICNTEVLHSAGITTANAVVLTMPDDESVLRACRVIRATRPGVLIAARTSFVSRAIKATELGADHVVIEEVATAEAMAKQVVQQIFQRLQSEPSAWIPADENDPHADEITRT